MNEIVQQNNEVDFFNPKNIDDAYRLGKCMIQSGFLPKGYTKPETVIVALQFARELGLKPLNALRQIAVVNGTPSLFGDLPLSLCRQSGLMESIREYYVDDKGETIGPAHKGDVYGAVCIVKRVGDTESHISTFTIEDQRKAGLNSGPWKQYTKRMLRYRARSQALKDVFPDCLNGIAIKEYDFDGVTTTDKNNRDSSLNDKLLLDN